MHNQHYLSAFVFLSLLSACMGTDDGDGNVIGTDSATVEVCDCELPAVTAADVSFDNTGTELQSMTVQEAVIEIGDLAAVTPPSFADKFSAQENELTQVAGTQLAVGAGCGGNQGDFLVLGGGCSTTSLNMTLVESRLTAELQVCRWQKPDGISETGKARVTCLSLLP